ncbi:MAG: TIGR04326 family surface carbohydrate biosynthesis protein [Ilumatobacteraceae bacterium]
MTLGQQVVIWDLPGIPPITSGTTVYWKEFFSPSRQQSRISLPQYVEDNGVDLKQRFLSFVRQVGEERINGKSTVEHLRISSGFSYWWMTLFACKRWSDSSHIIETVRLLAIEDILREIAPAKVLLATDQVSIESIIRELCAQNGIEFQTIPTPKSSPLDRKRQTRFITGVLRAIPVLAREMVRRIRAPKREIPPNSSPDIVLFDFFSRFNTADALSGKFRSGFWNGLVDHLENANQKTIFLHKFVADTHMPRRATARRILAGLNSTSPTSQHFLLDAQLSLRVVGRAVFIYFRLLGLRFRIRKIRNSFRPQGSQLDLWNLFEKEWLDSLSGSTAILHSLAICELDDTIASIPPCRTVLYLMENQPWEMALVQLWRSRRSEPIVGVPHSTIRFWDLRYFFEPGVFASDENSHPPTPNIVAVNGHAALNSLETSGIPNEQISEVEALPYLYLHEVQLAIAARKIAATPMRLLVLGDFFHNQNLALLTMLQNSLLITSRHISIMMKPHPLCPIDRGEFPFLQLRFDTRPLSEQLSECDVVLATNGTSASAEAYQCGVPVITVLNGETFNFSPLRNVPGSHFVESADQLARVLDYIEFPLRAVLPDYFCIDKSLSRWKNLLSI